MGGRSPTPPHGNPAATGSHPKKASAPRDAEIFQTGSVSTRGKLEPADQVRREGVLIKKPAIAFAPKVNSQVLSVNFKYIYIYTLRMSINM